MLAIKEFELKNLREYPKICIIGKRWSGKSRIVASLLDHYKNTRKVIISPSDKFNPFYSRADIYACPDIDNIEMHYEYTDDLIHDLMNKEREEEIVLVLDDCIYYHAYVSGCSLSNLIQSSRSHKITLIVTAQNVLTFKDNLNNNFDYIFNLKDFNTRQLRETWKKCYSIFPTFDSYCQVSSQLTKNYGSIVMDNYNSDNTLENSIFYYKANIKVEPQVETKQEQTEEKEVVNDSYITQLYNFVKSCMYL